MPAFSRNRSAVYLFLALLWLAASVCHAEMNDFWEVDDYLGQHPEQLERMTAFSARVAAPAQPLNERQRQIPVIRIAKIYPVSRTRIIGGATCGPLMHAWMSWDCDIN